MNASVETPPPRSAVDFKTRLKQLQDTVSYHPVAEFYELRSALLNILHGEPSVISAVTDVERADFWLPAQQTASEVLVNGLEIGPVERRFRLVRCVAANQLGAVWLAIDLAHSTPDQPLYKALKVFTWQLQPHEDIADFLQRKPVEGSATALAYHSVLNQYAYLIRLKTRADIAALLQHPHIAKAYGWRLGQDGWFFIEMDYVDHRTSVRLDRMLEQEGTPGLSWTRLLEITRPLVAALDYAHRERRILHGDLKLNDIFIDAQQTLRITGFAIPFPPLMQGREVRDDDEPATRTPLISQSRFRQEVSQLAAVIYTLLTAEPLTTRTDAVSPPLVKPEGLSDKAWQLLQWALEADTASTRAPTRPAFVIPALKPAVLSESAWRYLQTALAGEGDCPAKVTDFMANFEYNQSLGAPAAETTTKSSVSSPPSQKRARIDLDTIQRLATIDTIADADTATDPPDEGEVTLPQQSLDTLQPGLSVGPPQRRFRLMRRIGSERSRVWLARSHSDHKEVYRALKIIAPLADPEGRVTDRQVRGALIRMRTRARIAAHLRHPHIVTIYGWQQDENGWPFVEMDYVDNRKSRTFRQILQQEGAPGLPWPRVMQLVRPIAAALDYAHHHHQLPHGDLRLENALVDDQGVVKLLNFGLSYQNADLRNPTRSADKNIFLDTAAVAEQGYRQDKIALFAMIYELLMAQPAASDEQWLPKRPPQLNAAAWAILLKDLTADPRASSAPVRDSDKAMQRELQRLEFAQDPRRAQSALPIPLGAVVGVVLTLVVGVAAVWYVQQSSLVPDAPPTTHPSSERSASDTAAARTTDDRAFAAAQRIHAIEAYELYLRRCPSEGQSPGDAICQHREAALRAIQQLKQPDQIATLKTQIAAQWADTTRTPAQQIRALLPLVEQLHALDPKEPTIAATYQRIAQMYLQQAQQQAHAGHLSTARELLEQANRLTPNAPAVTTLRAEIEALERQADDAAYAAAAQANTTAAYRQYLAQCKPLCAHQAKATEAQRRIAEAARRPTTAAIPSPTSGGTSPQTSNVRDPLSRGGWGPELVMIPAGMATIGSPPTEGGRYDDERRHQVHIEKPFAIGRYEVTFDEYEVFARAVGIPVPADEGWGRGRRPVIYVTAQQAQAYTTWLSQQTGNRYRLPTEIEWEYAARAGAITARFWGNDPNQGCAHANAADLTGQAQYRRGLTMQCQDGYIFTAPVGSLKPNAFGLHDMLGNVAEWTCSAYDKGYQEARHCVDVTNASRVVVRGGAWNDEPRNVRLATRRKLAPTESDHLTGFRVVRE